MTRLPKTIDLSTPQGRATMTALVADIAVQMTPPGYTVTNADLTRAFQLIIEADDLVHSVAEYPRSLTPISERARP